MDHEPCFPPSRYRRLALSRLQPADRLPHSLAISPRIRLSYAQQLCHRLIEYGAGIPQPLAHGDRLHRFRRVVRDDVATLAWRLFVAARQAAAVAAAVRHGHHHSAPAVLRGCQQGPGGSRLWPIPAALFWRLCLARRCIFGLAIWFYLESFVVPGVSAAVHRRAGGAAAAGPHASRVPAPARLASAGLAGAPHPGSNGVPEDALSGNPCVGARLVRARHLFHDVFIWLVAGQWQGAVDGTGTPALAYPGLGAMHVCRIYFF